MSEKNYDFFAAANGYTGFRSYFDKVFNSEEYERIFVIKGGPGTGKSSFMKKIAGRYSERGLHVERILCSSDPSSLDGVIVEFSGKKIAMLDGTAPHERDAIIVGAIDEIINLGASLDSRFLKAQKEEIISINKEKKRAYATAYNYMNISGTAVSEKKRLISSHFDYKNAKNVIKHLAELSIQSPVQAEQVRLISAFGSHGRTRLSTIEGASERLYSVVGDYYAASLLLKQIYAMFKELGNDIILCPSPLDADCIEALYLPSQKVGFVMGGDGEVIDAEVLLPTLNKTDGECMKKTAEIEESSLFEAMRWFAIASDFHFRLEEQYIRAMNFQENDKIYEEKILQIDNIIEFLG